MRGHPEVVKVAGWLVGGGTMSGVGAERLHSIRVCNYVSFVLFFL